jgi:hypothetical protein
MSTVAPDTLAEPATASRRPSRWVAPLAAAAVVAGLAGGTVWWQHQRPVQDGAEKPASTLDLPADRGIVLDASGWTVDSSSGDGMVWRHGDANLEITSYPAASYDSYVTDREHIVDPPAPGAPMEVLGRNAQMWAYSADDHTAIREVEDGHWLEFRASGLDRDGFVALLGELRVAAEGEFDASLPDDFVTVSEREGAAADLLAEIRSVSGAGFPAGSSLRLGEGEAKDGYQFGAEVAGQYACAWLEAFENAKSHGQAARAHEAADVLGTSRQWPVLIRMDGRGDYPEVLWEFADQVAAGQVPEGYREGLGCP